MALILDESFLTGIPANFATARVQGGTFAATYNDALQAVDLSNSSTNYNIWEVTSLPFGTSGEMTADLELVSDSAVRKHFGVWLTSGVGAVSNGVRFSHLDSVYESSLWSGSTAFAGSATISSAPDTAVPLTVGTRRTFSARWDFSKFLPKNLELLVDGEQMALVNVSQASFRVGIFTYGVTARLHQIKVWDAPIVPFRDATFRGFQPLEGRLSSLPVEARDALGPRNHSRGQVQGSRNIYFAGNGRITGTVKEKGTASNTPVHRRVVLIDERTRLPVQEQWSDAATGVYNFIDVDSTHTFTVLSYDHTGAFRAVVADRIVPELIP